MHKASLKITGAEKYTQLLVSRTHGLARHLSSSNGRCRAVGAGPAWEPRAPLCLCRAVPAGGRDWRMCPTCFQPGSVAAVWGRVASAEGRKPVATRSRARAHGAHGLRVVFVP